MIKEVDIMSLPELKNFSKLLHIKQQKKNDKSYSTLSLDTPVSADKVRFVCTSDTHNQTKLLSKMLPKVGDIFVHAGDFTSTGRIKEVIQFNEFLGTVPYKYKVVIAGNHELSFEDDSRLKVALNSQGVENVRELLTNCIYLEDSCVTINGITIYGSPWQPRFCDWAFNVDCGEECLKKWRQIPDDTDVLITHGPPRGHGDMCKDGYRVGCAELLQVIQDRVQPKYHVFGHIHEGYGVTRDQMTCYVNASHLNARYQPVNPPVIFDVDLPDGVSKESLKAGLD